MGQNRKKIRHVEEGERRRKILPDRQSQNRDPVGDEGDSAAPSCELCWQLGCGGLSRVGR